MKTDLVREWTARPYAVRLTSLAEEDGGGWIAAIPQLGEDTYTGTGETETEALEHMRELQQYLFERLALAGDAPPPAIAAFAFPEDLPNGQVSLRLPREIHALAKLRAEANGCSLNSYLEAMLSLAMGTEIGRAATSGATAGAEAEIATTPVLASMVTPALRDVDQLPLAG